jgi:hypothetical protein
VHAHMVSVLIDYSSTIVYAKRAGRVHYAMWTLTIVRVPTHVLMVQRVAMMWTHLCANVHLDFMVCLDECSM